MAFYSKISRKKFIETLLWLLVFPVTFIIWVRMIQINRLVSAGKSKILLSSDFPPGITFNSNLIINNHQGQLTIFSAKCTHLGCLINHQSKNQIICPCHGSIFSSLGEPIKGPARNPLKKLDYSYDQTGKKIIVHLI